MKINWKSKILVFVTSLAAVFSFSFCAFSLKGSDDYEKMHRLFVMCKFIDKSVVERKLGPIFTGDAYADVSERTHLLVSVKSIWGQPEFEDVLPDVCKFFRTHRGMVNKRLVDGWYPLFHAVFHQKVELVRCLIDCGADVNCRSGPLHLTPLFQAVKDGDVSIINILLSCDGIDVNASCGDGECTNTPLGYAIRAYGEDSTIANLLRSHGAREEDSCNCCSIM